MGYQISDAKRREIIARSLTKESAQSIADSLHISKRTVYRVIKASTKRDDNGDRNVTEEAIERMTQNGMPDDVREKIESVTIPNDLGDYAKQVLLVNLEGLFQMLQKVENVPGVYGQITAENSIRKEIRMTAAQIGQWAGLGKEAEVGNAILAEFSKKYLSQPLKDVEFEEAPKENKE